MIDKINQERSDHILTIEDPIEYLHRHKKCIINQREVTSDTKSFASALRHVLRQDPDVILIGEMRDLETIEAALASPHTPTRDAVSMCARSHANSLPATSSKAA